MNCDNQTDYCNMKERKYLDAVIEWGKKYIDSDFDEVFKFNERVLDETR